MVVCHKVTSCCRDNAAPDASVARRPLIVAAALDVALVPFQSARAARSGEERGRERGSFAP
jgi:hypothetical protein